VSDRAPIVGPIELREDGVYPYAVVARFNHASDALAFGIAVARLEETPLLIHAALALEAFELDERGFKAVLR
jgi:hypothetical protein